MPDIVVVLPGILGSVLRKDDRDVWALSGATGFRGLLTRGQNLEALRLTEDPQDVDELDDGVVARSLIHDLHLIPYLWKIDGYSHLTRTIQANFEVEPGENYFEFPYDWRRDNRVAARRLRQQSRDWLERWRRRSGNAEAKLLLIAHSMGGLVARYFLEALEGWRDTKALITFGTPFRGSLNALDVLCNGFRKGPFDWVDLSTLVRSFTSVYQLLPVYRCIQGAPGNLVRPAESSLFKKRELEKARSAVEFHLEIERAVAHHLESDEYRVGRYQVVPIVGIHQPTSQSARIRGDGGLELLNEFEGRDYGGDSTVPRVSATPIELGNQGLEAFSAARHASLQNSDAVLTHLIGVITGLYIDLGTFRALGQPAVSLTLDLEDAYWNDEPLTIGIRADPPPSPALELALNDVDTNQLVAKMALPGGQDDWIHAEVAPLPTGHYRLRVRGGSGVQDVSDIIGVYPRSS